MTESFSGKISAARLSKRSRVRLARRRVSADEEKSSLVKDEVAESS